MSEGSRSAGATAKRAPSYAYDAERSGFAYALGDLAMSIRQPALVATLVRTGFSGRHSGPLRTIFWTMAVTTAVAVGLGLIYGQILGRFQDNYLPYVATGIIVWGLLSSSLNDGAGVFLAASGVYGQTPISKSIFALRAVGLLGLFFIVKLPVLIGILILSGVSTDLTGVALSAVGALVILWVAFWFALGWGTVAARFHDVPQLTSTLVTFSFFVTPIFWNPSMLGHYRFIVDYNPLYHLLNTIRGPLLSLDGVTISFVWAGGLAVIAPVAGFTVFGLFARRLNYWS